MIYLAIIICLCIALIADIFCLIILIKMKKETDKLIKKLEKRIKEND
jgi:hypothetical protein